jgi:spoIIIJ-associated protein
MKDNSKKAIAFEGKTLEEAYQKASKEFNCSITNLASEVLQAPSNGFLGLFKKNAIINVYSCDIDNIETIPSNKEKIKIKDVSEDIKSIHSDEYLIKDTVVEKVFDYKKDENGQKIFNDFYSKEKDNSTQNINELSIENDDIIESIKSNVNDLFSKTCYIIDEIKVSYYDKNTVFIEFSGPDAALLIGKEGYRYKALSYILFNWIHDKYNLMLRLEVAQFLVQQEKAVDKYLEPVIVTIKEEGSFKTKPFDGILVHIALTRLRSEFPDMYVAVKTNIKGDRYILVNKYKK